MTMTHGNPGCVASGCQHPLCVLVRETTPRRRSTATGVPAVRVREHIEALRLSGWSMKALAEHAGYPSSTLHGVASGRHQFTSRFLAEDILSIPLKEAAA